MIRGSDTGPDVQEKIITDNHAWVESWKISMFQTRNGNQELILVANWFPLVQFLGIVSPLLY